MIWSYPPFRLSPQLLQLSGVLISCYLSCVSAGLNSPYNGTRCIDKEREALLAFKRGIEVDHCGMLASWTREEDNRDCCKWHGVQCNNRMHVIMLDLHGSGTDGSYNHGCHLEGNLSVSLSELKHLKYLDLSSNNFKGRPIPTFLGTLTKLKHLNLSYSQFAGEMSFQIGNFSRLTVLDLSYNYHLFAYSLHWLSHLTSLQYLGLSNTYLLEASDWFQAVNSLPFLRVLNLNLCLLPSTNFVPLSYINSSTHFEVINLANNFLNDSSIFEWLFNLTGFDTHLVHLDLSQNLLEGQIPSALGDMGALSYLDLSGNHLEGPIPSSIGDIRSLSYLDLSHNLLTGLIPDTVGKLKSLTSFKLSGNSITGPIPDKIRKLQTLTYLKLSNNLLSGPIPDAIRELKFLEYLDLSDNSFLSSIPSFLGYMLHLTSLDLSQNLLTGAIPSQLDQLGLLSSLDLSFNQLSGSIPPGLWKFPVETFLGNLHLCGEPLPDCPLGEGGDVLHQQNAKGGKDNFYLGLFVCAGVGFYIGFWVVCGTLVFKHSWRYAFFQFIDNIMNKIYVTIAIYMNRSLENTQT